MTILVLLFLFQRFGTARIGAVFGPAMLPWLTVLAVLGVSQIAQEPAVLAALSPLCGVRFFIQNGFSGFLVLGSVFVLTKDCWGWSLPLALGVSGLSLVIDLAFLGANLSKVPEGGWFPLVVAALLFVLMTTWKRGRTLVIFTTARKHASGCEKKQKRSVGAAKCGNAVQISVASLRDGASIRGGQSLADAKRLTVLS